MTRQTAPERSAHTGFTDEELEDHSRLHGMFDSRVLPWAMWESEHTSYGRAFRKVARYPRHLPLFFGCDHGVMHGARCWSNETDSAYPVFFTWLLKKRDAMVREHGKRSYHVAHPWSYYRQQRFPDLPSDRRGTLVYFPHSNGTSNHLFDVKQYVADLNALPPECHPIVICLSFHDVVAGVHKTLRPFGIPLVTAGHGSSQDFIDRFYGLLYQFRYASSPNVGSHTFYIMEAGVPFFLYGPYPQIEIKGSAYVPDGVYGEEILGDEEDLRRINEFIAMLYERTNEVTPAQRAHIVYYLGLDSKTSRRALARVIWREGLSPRNWVRYGRSILQRFRTRVRSR